MGLKPIGMNIYVDANNSGVYTLLGCAYANKPPGHTRGITSSEPCLQDGISQQDTDSLEFTPWSFTLDYEVDSGGLLVEAQLRTAIQNDTIIPWSIEVPTSPATFVNGNGKLTQMEPQDWSATENMKTDFTVLPTEEWTFGLTAPPTS